MELKGNLGISEAEVAEEKNDENIQRVIFKRH
jgi:hypothetical protein